MPASPKIPGLYQKRGWWYFKPSQKGARGATRMVALKTRDLAEAIVLSRAMAGIDLAGPGDDIAGWAARFVGAAEASDHYARKTLAGIRQALEALAAFAGAVEPRALTRADALDWFAALSDGRSHATAHRYIRYARVFFSWLIERRAVAENPFSKLRLPAPRQTRRDKFLSPGERDRLIGRCDRADLALVLHLGFFAGLRLGEIVAARRSWLVPGAIVVGGEAGGTGRGGGWQAKTGRQRMVPLHPRLAALLPEPAPDCADHLIHPEITEARRGEYRWHPHKAFRKACAEADLGWVGFHTMRHTFASLHVMAGTPDYKVIRWLGITRETFDRHYAGLSPGDPDVANI